MRLISKNKTDANGRTILVVADCLHGAMAAGRFAVRNIYDSNSRLLLLQTYQKPQYGQSMLRDITAVIEKTAKEELTKLKSEMVKEFSLPTGSIGKVVIEGELTTVLRTRFGNIHGLSVVVGYDPRLSYRVFPCRSVIRKVTDSGLRPLFVVSDNITLIDGSNIVLFTGDEKKVSSDYLGFLEEMTHNNRMRMTTLTAGNSGKFKPDRETILHLPTGQCYRSDNLTGGELLFRQEVQRINIE